VVAVGSSMTARPRTLSLKPRLSTALFGLAIGLLAAFALTRTLASLP
jgi:hypothetical protein